MAMRIRWYGAESITQYGRSRATLDATAGLRHLGGTFLFSFHFFWAGIQGRIPVPAGFRQNPAATSLMFRLFYGPEPYLRSGPESVPV